MTDKILADLHVAEYIATDAFRSIEKHVAICDPDGNLIAVVGPAGNALSTAYAYIFATAPAKLKVLRTELLRVARVNHAVGNHPDNFADCTSMTCSGARCALEL
jgi:hypothetical protein